MALLDLYRSMTLARAFEAALADLWHAGLISGELHLATGEEALLAGLCAHLGETDAVALDHRPSAMMALRGVDLEAMVAEMVGDPGGLCRGCGGHMHLFSRERLAASSGIVGSSGPTAAGFALAARQLRPGSVALALFGDGAMNQGMLLEAFNLAVAWRLPVLFVCKDNRWAITTRSADVTGGDLEARAASFGLATATVDGLDAEACEAAAVPLITGARGGRPGFLRAQVARLDGHLLGDPLRRMAEHPLAEGATTFGQVTLATLRRDGAALLGRLTSVSHILRLMRHATGERRDGHGDPLPRARAALAAEGLSDAAGDAERVAAERVGAAVAAALGNGSPAGRAS